MQEDNWSRVPPSPSRPCGNPQHAQISDIHLFDQLHSDCKKIKLINQVRRLPPREEVCL